MPRSTQHDQLRETAPAASRITKAERRRHLLACARQVFAERGAHGTTLELVAEVAGVTETILGKYFPDPPALLQAVLQEVRKATLDRWQTETVALADPLTKLHAFAEMYLGGARTDAEEYQILRRALADCEMAVIADELRRFFAEAETFLAVLIAEGQQSGVFHRSLDPRVGAWKLLHAGLGQVVTQPLGLPAPSTPDSLGRTVECLLNGLLKTDV